MFERERLDCCSRSYSLCMFVRRGNIQRLWLRPQHSKRPRELYFCAKQPPHSNDSRPPAVHVLQHLIDRQQPLLAACVVEDGVVPAFDGRPA